MIFFQKNPVLTFVLPSDFVPFCLTLYFSNKGMKFLPSPYHVICFQRSNSSYLLPHLAIFFQSNQVLTFLLTMRFVCFHFCLGTEVLPFFSNHIFLFFKRTEFSPFTIQCIFFHKNRVVPHLASKTKVLTFSLPCNFFKNQVVTLCLTM